MAGTITEIWRYPIKSHGSERLEQANLSPGQTLPGDRIWAVLHEAAKDAPDGWISCNNFTRVTKMPMLAAMRAVLSTDETRVTLTHPTRPDLELAPDTDEDLFLEWVRPLMDPSRAQPVRLVKAVDRGLTDSPEPTLSLNNLSSHRAVSQKIGRELNTLRWRGNVWLDGLGPWEEFEWVGRKIKLGTAELDVVEPIGRCLATAANPETGRRDADTLGALMDGWNHQNFGVYAVVTKSGVISEGDTAQLIA
ncbi:MOSC domain-containing protein [Tropicimonas sp. S265A]|uniref:MOSC domain-containing protein n=1 Tax=Tropicimonas sp. S265A TaxID=3415134 RepID=UPI003C7E79A6